MATTMSSAWAKPGAWALDSEQHEDELASAVAAAITQHAPPPEADFPSLSAAVTAPKPKKKTKKTLSLGEFTTYTPPSSAAASPAVDVVLPTGPRERTAEEIAESRRGGFRNYGGDRPRVSRDGYDGDSNRTRDMGPSRADEADDWGKSKKFSSFGPGSGPDRERDMGPSRADEVDDWSKGKKFGGGFGLERGEKREKMGFFNSSRADDVDNWGANKGFGSGLIDDRRRERRVGFEATGPGSDVDSWVKGKENGGSGSVSGRPRLNLQPRTLPVVSANNNNNINNVDRNVGGGGEGEVAVVKSKGNPFGEARPREEVLKEKGKDWKEIDEKLEAVNKIKEVERSSVGDRRGFGFGRSDSGDDRSVRAWRKPGLLSNAAGVAPPSAETIEKSAEPEITESTEKTLEDN